MATCPKCRGQASKRRAGVFSCRRCGLFGVENGHILDRMGNALPDSKPPEKFGPFQPYILRGLHPVNAPATYKGKQHV